MVVHDTTPFSRVLVPRTSFTAHHIGPLGRPYLGFHPPTPSDTFYLLLSSIDLFCPLFCPILLSSLPCTCPFLLPFFSRTDFYYTWRMDSFSIVSSFPPSSSSTPDHTFCFPIHIVTSLCIFQAVLY